MNADVDKAPKNLQMELIELQEDLILNSQFNDIALTDFYKLYLVEEKYTNIRVWTRKIISLFGSTYTCAQFFRG